MSDQQGWGPPQQPHRRPPWQQPAQQPSEAPPRQQQPRWDQSRQPYGGPQPYLGQPQQPGSGYGTATPPPGYQQSPPGYGYPRPQQGYPSGPHRGHRPPRKRYRVRNTILGLVGGLVLISVIASVASSHNGVTKAPAPHASATTAPAAATSPAFPPASLAAFKAFAATGDASEITQVGFVSNGLPSCPEPTYYVTIPSSLGVRAVEADLSAFFVQKNGFASNACGGAVVFAYHSLSDYNANKSNVFTAGRVIVTKNSPGPPYNLEVDAGADLSPTGSFSFNF
jgi:hypothetical protein